MHWMVYLSGEIHSDWRQQIMDGAAQLDLPVSFSSANTNHEASDAAGIFLHRRAMGFGEIINLRR